MDQIFTVIKDMNFIDLGTGYHLTGFADFESAFAATEQLTGMGLKVAYLNEASYISDPEVVGYAKKCASAGAASYRNYHFGQEEQIVATATESIRTAVEVLEEKMGSKAKFILVVQPKTVKVSKLQVA